MFYEYNFNNQKNKIDILLNDKILENNQCKTTILNLINDNNRYILDLNISELVMYTFIDNNNNNIIIYNTGLAIFINENLNYKIILGIEDVYLEYYTKLKLYINKDICLIFTIFNKILILKNDQPILLIDDPQQVVDLLMKFFLLINFINFKSENSDFNYNFILGNLLEVLYMDFTEYQNLNLKYDKIYLNI